MNPICSTEDILRYRLKGLSNKEIGKIVGLTTNGVWTRLSRAGFKTKRKKLDYLLIDGIKFTQQRGYYRSTTNIGKYRMRLHTYVYEKEYGKILKGYVIHHKDFNKLNNSIENLVKMTDKEHKCLHSKRERDSKGMFI